MIFELHLTTKPDVQLADWVGWCNRNQQKALDIRLINDSAANPRQIMSAGVYDGSHAMALAWVLDLQDKMTSAYTESVGFPIERAKLEVPLDKSGPYAGRVHYYESHVKSLVEPRHFDAVLELATEQGWHASYNALYDSVDGLRKVYLTKRISGESNYIDAGHEFALRFQSLVPNTFRTVRMESEAVIEDTNPQMDEGWADLWW